MKRRSAAWNGWRRPASLLVALALLAAGAARSASEPQAPRRAVLVSFDGLGGLELQRRLDSGLLSPDGFARALREGASAERLTVVTPSLTAVSHASISTGAPPSVTGIVSNLFRPAGSPLGTRVSGFEVEPEEETLWEAARKQGRRVASICWPGMSQKGPRTTTDVSLVFNEEREYGQFLRGPSAELPLSDARVLPPDVVSFSPPKSLSLPLSSGDRPAATCLLVDPHDDGRRGYSELLLLDDAGQVAARAHVGEWFAVTRRRDDDGERDVLFGRWAKLLALAPDLSSFALYLGPEWRNRAWPEDFRRTIDKEAGFWPGAPDSGFLLQREPDAASFLEQVQRFSRFFVKAFEAARRRGDWDLLLAYQPIVDEGQHALTLVDPRQPFFTRGNAELASAALREVFRSADRAAAAYLSFEGDGDVLFVSDHGMRPMIRSYNVLEALRRQGVLRLAKDPTGRTVVAADSPVDATTSGGIAHVYVSREGAVPGGTVSAAEAEALVAKMAAAFRSARDETGEPVFSRVLTRKEAGELSLDHPSSGDLVLISRGSTSLRAFLRAGESPLFVEPENLGQHGFDPDPELDGIFFHVGSGVSPRRLPAFGELEVAGLVASRLGLRFHTSKGMSDDTVATYRIPRSPAAAEVSLVEATGLPDAVPRTRATLSQGEKGLLVSFECESEPPLSIVQPRGAAPGSPVWADECVEVFLAEGTIPTTYLELVVNPAGAVYAARVANPDNTRSTWKVSLVPPPPGLAVEVSGEPGPDPRAWTRWRCRLEVPWSAFESGAPAPGGERRANLYRIARGRSARYAALSPTLRSPADFHVPRRFARLSFPGTPAKVR